MLRLKMWKDRDVYISECTSISVILYSINLRRQIIKLIPVIGVVIYYIYILYSFI